MRRTIALLLPALIIAATIIVGWEQPAAAQDDEPLSRLSRLQVVTDYPMVTAEAGDTISFDLEVLAPTREAVAIAVTDTPENWSTTLRGGGFEIGAVTADPESPPRTELEVTIPPTAEPDRYDLTIAADSPTATDELEISVLITDRPVGGIVLTTDFAQLRGRPSDTFRYDLDVTNQTPEEITLAFDASGPQGWTVTAGPASEQRASTIIVEPGDTESVRVEADPPASADAGEYPIEVRATGGGQSGSFALTAIVTGKASLDLRAAGNRLDITGNAGDSATAIVFVVNDGSAPLEDVRLSADPPAEWEVEFEPDEIPVVPAGDSTPVTVEISPTGDAVAGDYALSVTARASGESDEVPFRFTVETSAWWGAVGIAIILAALAVVMIVFRRFGRR